MRKMGKGLDFRRNNVSFHTGHEKWVWSIILNGTCQRRVITSFVHTSRCPLQDLIPRGICEMWDTFSTLFWFIVWRQRWLRWVFMVGNIRRGNSCYHDDLISCEFRVCAAVPLPFPPCSSLLFPLNQSPFSSHNRRRGTFCPPLHCHCFPTVLIRYFHLLFPSTLLLNPEDSQGQQTQGKDKETAVRRIPWPVSPANYRYSA